MRKEGSRGFAIARSDRLLYLLISVAILLLVSALYYVVLIGNQQQRLQLFTLEVVLVSPIRLAQPQQVSTVLYVVQRMIELVTLLTLLGITLYLLSRQDLNSEKKQRSMVMMSAGEP